MDYIGLSISRLFRMKIKKIGNSHLFINIVHKSSIGRMAKRFNRRVSEATKFKMSLAKQGTKNPMSGKHHDDETKRKISQSMLKYWRSISMF